jgi:hypothetical protein
MIRKEIISQLRCTTPNCPGELRLVDIFDCNSWYLRKAARYHCRICHLDYLTENYEKIVEYDTTWFGHVPKWLIEGDECLLVEGNIRERFKVIGVDGGKLLLKRIKQEEETKWQAD